MFNKLSFLLFLLLLLTALVKGQATISWDGSESTDWSEPLNWDLNRIPNATDEVSIPTNMPNDCIIPNGTDAVAFGITVNQASFSISTGGALSLNGAEVGFLMQGNASVANINGSLNISDVTMAGLLIEGGTMNVLEDGSLNIQNAGSDGISLFGTLILGGLPSTVLGAGLDGVRIDGGTLYIMENKEFLVTASGEDGISVIDNGTINVAGMLLSTNQTEDGIDTEQGSLIIQSSGSVTIEGSQVVGFNNANFTNDGELSISNTGDDGIKTLENCTNNGLVVITDSSRDGLNVEEQTAFANNGRFEVSDAARRAIDGGDFLNNAGGVLVAEGDITVSITFDPDSHLIPGPGVDCLNFLTTNDLNGCTVEMEINGSMACNDHDRIKTEDPLTVDGARLVISGDYADIDGTEEEIVLLLAMYSGTFVGTFENASPGSILRLSGLTFSVEYREELTSESIVLVPVTLPTPINDDFEDALVVSTLPYSHETSADEAFEATTEASERDCGPGGSFWYTYTPTAGGTYRIASEIVGATEANAATNLSVGVYQGDDLIDMSLVTCAMEDNGEGEGEVLFINLDAGERYNFRIALEGYNPFDDVITTSIEYVGELVWNGSVSTDWDDPANWTPNQVPTTQDFVYIVGGTNNACSIQTSGGNPTAAVARTVVVVDQSFSIAAGSSLTLDQGVSGLVVRGASSFCSIEGDLSISNMSEDGINMDAGLMIFGISGGFSIDGVSDEGIDIDVAEMIVFSPITSINNAGDNGMVVDDAGSFDLSSNAELTISNSVANGVLLLNDGYLGLNGTLISQNSGKDGVASNSGSFFIGAPGVLRCEDSADYGIDDANFTNNGIIQITNTGRDGIDTDFECYNNGSIYITGTGETGIDIEIDSNFINQGYLEITNASEKSIKDGKFVNTDGGTLVVSDMIDSDFVSDAGSEIIPGPGVGCITFEQSANLAWATVNIEINGPEACSDYDQLIGQDVIIVINAVVTLSGDYVPQVGDSFMVIKSEGDFNPFLIEDWDEGSTVVFNGVELTISYQGGDGNDVVLTATGTPPVNDDLESAIVFDPSGDYHEVVGENGQFATTETDEVNCGTTVSWWYALTPEVTNTYGLIANENNGDAIDSTNNVTLGIYTGDGHSLEEIACFDNDNGETGGEFEDVTLTAGVTYYIRVGVQGVPGQTDIRTTIIKRPFNWLGTEDSDWYNANNWENGLVPGVGNDVSVSVSINDPVISSGMVSIGELNIFSGSFTLAEGATLNLSGGDYGLVPGFDTEVFIDGTVNIDDIEDTGLAIIVGSVTIGSTGSITLNNTTISNGGTLIIEGSLAVYDSPERGFFSVNNSTTTVAEGASFIVDNAANQGLLIGGPFINNGTITVTSSGGNGVSMSGVSELIIGATGSFEILDSEGYGFYTTFSATIENAGLFAIAGSLGNAMKDGTINNAAGSIFRVNGVVNGDAIFDPGSRVEPGSSPGCLAFTKPLNLTETTLVIEIEGPAGCSDYDSMTAVSDFNITDATLELAGSYVPLLGEVFSIVVDGEEPVEGTFANLPEGGTLTFNGVELVITYLAGNFGNNIELTAISILPVELLEFTGRINAKTNVLNWSTASEEDFSYFEVERSVAGAQWAFWGAVAGAGEVDGVSSGPDGNAYTFLDEQPLPTGYYRLKMVDLDGAFAYSEVVLLERGLGLTAGALQVYPNPSDGQFTLTIPDPEIQTLSLYNPAGQLVWSQRSSGVSRSVAEGSTEVSLVVTFPGLYLLVATSVHGQRWTERLLVR